MRRVARRGAEDCWLVVTRELGDCGGDLLGSGTGGERLDESSGELGGEFFEFLCESLAVRVAVIGIRADGLGDDGINAGIDVGG